MAQVNTTSTAAEYGLFCLGQIYFLRYRRHIDQQLIQNFSIDPGAFGHPVSILRTGLNPQLVRVCGVGLI